MTALNSISKETFFLDALVPTGLVAELLIPQMISLYHKDENAALGAIVWEPLNLVSHYVLSTHAKTQGLPALRRAVLNYQTVLIEMLDKQVPAKRPRYGRRTSLELATSLKAASDSIQQLIGLTTFKETWKPARKKAKSNDNPPVTGSGKSTPEQASGYKEAWVKEHLNGLLPPEMASVAKWRTFSRNLDPQKMARELDLGLTLVSEAAKLSSHSGAQSARKLWHECFSVEASGSKRKPHKRLPENVTVEVFPSGIFEVVATFHPRVRLGIKVEKALSPELADRLHTQIFRTECGYDGVASSVKKAIAWQQKQEESLAQLKTDVDATLERNKADAIYEKFSSTFSAEEIEVLRKRMATA